MTQPIRDLVDAKYGENKDYVAQQQAAPIQATQTTAPPPPSPNPQQPPADADPAAAYLNNLPNISPLSAPTERPTEPVTAGAPMGAGSNFLMSPQQPGAFSLSSNLQSYAAGDPTGAVAWLAHQLSEMGQ